MADRRPFPPSPRRLALARQAGLTAASPFLVGALATGAAIVATVLVARDAATRLGSWIAAASSGSEALSLADVPGAILDLAAPLLLAAAAIAVLAHVVQTRAFWLPRRRIQGAPALDNGAAPRTARTAFELAAAAIIGLVAFGWLWSTAPRLAFLVTLDTSSATPSSPPAPGVHAPSSLASSVGAAIASLVIALAIAWLVLAVVDALLRRAQLQRALAMTPTEKREDDRLAAADPRWKAHRAAIAKGPAVGDAVARAAVVLLGDGTAVAIAWDPTRQPVPLRTATGRAARSTQILALARRHRIAVHRDAALAAALVDGDGLVPDIHWRKLADIIAAVGSRRAA
jgi:flagellar biosynthesis protein FlhB